MNPNESEELYRDAMIKIVDRAYGEQYAELFPDIEPPVETLDGLDVGDVYMDSDEFIYMVIDTYKYEADMVLGTYYKPPRVSDIAEHIRLQYEEELEISEENGDIEEGACLDFMLTVGPTIDSRVVTVLDVLGLTYIEEELVTWFNPKTNKTETKIVPNRIMNTSTISLFDFDFKNIWIDRGSEAYAKSIQEGYSGMLRINLADIW